MGIWRDSGSDLSRGAARDRDTLSERGVSLIQSAPAAAPPRGTALALAAFACAVQFYTSLAALSPTPSVGPLLVGRGGAAAIAALLVAAALWCAFAIVRRRISPSGAILAPWFFALLIPSLFGFAPAEGLAVTAMFLLAACFHTAFIAFGSDRRVRAAVFGSLLVTGALAAASAIGFVLFKHPAALYSFNNGRAAGPFVTANQCAAFCTLFFALAAGIALSTAGVWRALAIGGAVVAVVALLLTYSVGGWIAFAVELSLIAFIVDRRAGPAIAVLAVVALIVAVPRVFLAHHTGEQFARAGSWHAAWRIFELFPLTGAGPVEYWRIYPAVRPIGADALGEFGALHAHNEVLSLLADIGILGTAAVFAGWFSFGKRMRRELGGASSPARGFALALLAGLLANFVQGAVDLIGVVQLTFVWVPWTALALVAARDGPPAAP